jgi:hypothetical protein
MHIRHVIVILLRILVALIWVSFLFHFSAFATTGALLLLAGAGDLPVLLLHFVGAPGCLDGAFRTLRLLMIRSAPWGLLCCLSRATRKTEK